MSDSSLETKLFICQVFCEEVFRKKDFGDLFALVPSIHRGKKEISPKGTRYCFTCFPLRISLQLIIKGNGFFKIKFLTRLTTKTKNIEMTFCFIKEV